MTLQTQPKLKWENFLTEFAEIFTENSHLEWPLRLQPAQIIRYSLELQYYTHGTRTPYWILAGDFCPLFMFHCSIHCFAFILIPKMTWIIKINVNMIKYCPFCIINYFSKLIPKKIAFNTLTNKISEKRENCIFICEGSLLIDIYFLITISLACHLLLQKLNKNLILLFISYKKI